jgi:hypothetical protein
MRQSHATETNGAAEITHDEFSFRSGHFEPPNEMAIAGVTYRASSGGKLPGYDPENGRMDWLNYSSLGLLLRPPPAAPWGSR